MKILVGTPEAKFNLAVRPSAHVNARKGIARLRVIVQSKFVFHYNDNPCGCVAQKRPGFGAGHPYILV